MRLLFFQNCVSPHQMPYIEELAQRHDVVVIVPFIAYESREMMGWGQYETSASVRMIVSPTDEEVQALFEEPYEGKTIALFSGISAFRDVKPWFLISLYYPVGRGIITEAPYVYRYPLWMHKLRFLLQDYKYVKYIDYIFAIGKQCEDYYETWGASWKIVPFNYCVAPRPESEPIPLVESEYANFCFVGALERRKNVITILKAFSMFRQKHREACKQCRMIIVGDGPRRQYLENYVKNNELDSVVSFTGTLSMNAARQIISQCDALILPSLYDGWGAVINEALMEGTMVYCSDTCGASVLIDHPSRGRIFKAKDAYRLSKYLWNDYGFFLDKTKTTHRRSVLREWSMQNICPKANADKMEAALLKYDK